MNACAAKPGRPTALVNLEWGEERYFCGGQVQGNVDIGAGVVRLWCEGISRAGLDEYSHDQLHSTGTGVQLKESTNTEARQYSMY